MEKKNREKKIKNTHNISVNQLRVHDKYKPAYSTIILVVVVTFNLSALWGLVPIHVLPNRRKPKRKH